VENCRKKRDPAKSKDYLFSQGVVQICVPGVCGTVVHLWRSIN